MKKESTPVRIGVIGAGRLGTFHAKKLSSMPDVVLAGVVDPIQAQREALAWECQCPSWPSHGPLLKEADAVIVATPATKHFAVARDALESGCHVFVEKPLTVTGPEADFLARLAQQSRLVLQVGHSERFNPAFLAARPHLKDVWLIEAIRQGPFSFRATDVGCVFDLMVHDLDLVQTIVPSPVMEIEGSGIAVLGQHEDVAQVAISFVNGARAFLRASRVETQPVRFMRVWTATAAIDIDFAARKTVICSFSDQLLSGALDIAELSPAEMYQLKDTLESAYLQRWEPPVPEIDPLEAELREFVRAIRSGHPPAVTAEEGRDTVHLAEAVLDSIKLWRVGSVVKKEEIYPMRRAA